MNLNINTSESVSTLTPALPRRRRRPADRLAGRAAADSLLAAANLLPAPGRRLLQDFYLRRRSLAALAGQRGDTIPAIRRRLSRLRRRLADPCFVLAVQFARRLPPDLAALARLHYYEGRPLAACAQQLGLAPHRARQAAALARAMLILAGAEKYGGRDARGQLFIASLLGITKPNIHRAQTAPIQLRGGAENHAVINPLEDSEVEDSEAIDHSEVTVNRAATGAPRQG